MHQMFSVHTTPEEFENVTIIDHFGFVVEENFGRENTLLMWRHRFSKALFSKCFPSVLKRKASVFKFSVLESVFEKLRFRDRLVWTVGLSCVFKFLRHSVGPS